MKENTDKYLDDLAKKIIKEGSIESPSFNFIESVMSQVLNLNKNHAIVYKPLISKSVWFLILAAIIMIVIYTVYSGEQLGGVSWINQIDFGVLSNDRMAHLFHFNFSKHLSDVMNLLNHSSCGELWIEEFHLFLFSIHSLYFVHTFSYFRSI